MRLNSLLALAAVATTAATSPSRGCWDHDHHDQGHPDMVSRDEADAEGHCPHHKDFRFLNERTRRYLVEELPDVPFDVGEMYSGLVPIDWRDKSRSLYFVFQPTTGEPVDEITIYLNGGPGCSSMMAFLQENGRFLWKPGTFRPVENPYSWTNLTNMMWVDQPVGTGFATGKPNATTEEETAQDFVHFFKNFQEIFGIRKFKIYVTGESYAGRYVPYISAAMLDQKDEEHFDLEGALMYDPCIGDCGNVQLDSTAVPMVQENKNIFNLNQTYLAEIDHLYEKCGYKDYIEKYLQFPPSEMQPNEPFADSQGQECSLSWTITNEVKRVNPCFSNLEITQMCPLLWSVLAFPTDASYLPEGATIYFDRDDVRRAMHAPDIKWQECSSEPVFVGGPNHNEDLSEDSIIRVLPQVIGSTNRVLVSNGDYDFNVIRNGTLMAIQNMTWNDNLGFQSHPEKPVVITLPDLRWDGVLSQNGVPSSISSGSQGVMGIQHYERGLMWMQTFQCGHMQAQYQPRVAYRHLQWMLGHVDSL